MTTLALVLGAVWPTERTVVVAECDPSGGDLAGRFGLSTRIGMTSLVLTRRQCQAEVPDYRDHTQQLPGGLDVLVAPPGADSAMALDHELGMTASELVPEDCDLVVDCGRLLPGAEGQEGMIRSADDVLLLVRPDVAGIAHARWAMAWIEELSRSPGSVLVCGQGAYGSSEVAQELGGDVLGTVPLDSRAALVASGEPGTAREFVRSGLVAFARELVDAFVEPPTVDSAPMSVFEQPSSQDREGASQFDLLGRRLGRMMQTPSSPDMGARMNSNHGPAINRGR